MVRFPLWNLPTRAKNKQERLLFPYLLFVYNPGGILIDVYLLSGRGQPVLCDKMETATHPNTEKYETIYWGYVATTLNTYNTVDAATGNGACREDRTHGDRMGSSNPRQDHLTTNQPPELQPPALYAMQHNNGWDCSTTTCC